MKTHLIYIGVILIAFIFLFKTCDNNRRYRANIESLEKNRKQNELALSEKTREILHKDSSITYERKNLVMTIDELKATNADLADKVKQEEGRHDKVKYITDTRIQYRSPVLFADNRLVDYGNSLYGLSFNKRDSVQHLSGVSRFYMIKKDSLFSLKPDKTIIDTNEIRIRLVAGIKEHDGFEEIFVHPLDKNVTVTSLEGARILKKNELAAKPHRFGLSVTTGYGALLNMQSGVIYHGPVIGLGLSYTLLRF